MNTYPRQAYPVPVARLQHDRCLQTWQTPANDAARYRSVSTLSVVPSVTNRMLPWSRVVITRASGAYSPQNFKRLGMGMPKPVVGPHRDHRDRRANLLDELLRG